MIEAGIVELRERIQSFPDITATVGEGPERLFGNFKVIPIDLLVKAEWNYKEEDERKAQKLAGSIRRNGQVENVLARELPTGCFEVINGNHRYDALVALGFRYVVAYDFGTITLAEAQRVAIETNEIRFDSDRLKLAEIMSQLSVEFGADDLSLTMPYSPEEITAFDRLVDFDWSDPTIIDAETTGHSPTGKLIKLTVPEETYNVWQKWLERCQGYGVKEEPAAFEIAITEALRAPEGDSLAA